jgi:sodium/proline symporter
MAVLYFTIYIASGLVSLGLIVESLFGLSYLLGVSFGLLIIVVYLFLGGYKTVAWIDLFQGFFLLAVIVFIPIFILTQIGSVEPIFKTLASKNMTSSLFPDFSTATFWGIIMTVTSWGLGYFGQPHIITKFMGIRCVTDMSKAKWVGISWQTIALMAATWVGLIGVFMFPEGIAEPEQLILEIVKITLAPFFAGIVLCAILAATTNVMAAQILVVASNLTEDFYKKFFRRLASQQELLWVSRASVLLVSFVGYSIAFFKPTTIYKLVLYSWSGLGAAFGPLLILSLYTNNITRQGAFAGILVGGLTAAIWPYFQEPLQISAVLAGFIASVLAIEITSYFTKSSKPKEAL